MNIPRFNAQLQSIQVPSLKNYQAEENAAIANSLYSFGDSVLKTTKKIQDEYIKEQQERQKKQQKANNELAKFELETTSMASLNAGIYNGGLQSIDNIYNTTENPAEANEYSAAYVQGSASQMPENSQYIEFMTQANDAHQEVAQEQYNETKTAESIQDAARSLDVAGSFLKNAQTDKMFDVYFSNILAQNRQAIAAGITDAKGAEDNIRRSLKGYASERYRRVMADDSVSLEERLAYRDSFVSGENDFDKSFNMLTYNDRQAIANSVDAEIQSRNAQLQKYEKEQEDERHKGFMNETARTIYDVSSMNMSPDQADLYLRERLEPYAKTKEEFEYLRKLRETGPEDAKYMVDHLEALKLDGKLTQEDLDVARTGDKINTKTYSTYVSYLNTPLYSNQQTRNYKDIKARINDKFPSAASSGVFFISGGTVSGVDDNKEMRNKVMQYLNSRVSDTTQLTQDDWMKIQKDVMDYADQVSSGFQQKKQQETKSDFVRYNIDETKMKKLIAEGDENKAQAQIYKMLVGSGVDKKEAQAMSADMIMSIKSGE